MLNVRGKHHYFRHKNGCSCQSVKVLETENVSTSGMLEHPTSGFMPNALTIWAIRARHLLSHAFEHWLWWYIYFEAKLTFEMLTVPGQQHSFSTHEQCFCESVNVFETENVSPWRGLEPPTFGLMPNALTNWTNRARHLLSQVFECLSNFMSFYMMDVITYPCWD